MQNIIKKDYPALDLLKFIAAIIIVCIHTTTLPFEILSLSSDGLTSGDTNMLVVSFYPLLMLLIRTAVPFFFICSSFLLFNRIKQDEQNKWTYVLKYIKRIGLLALFWFIMALPRNIYTYFISGQYDFSFGLLKWIINIFWAFGFGGSWYLAASVISTLLVALLYNKKPWVSYLIAGVLYFVAAFQSNYLNILQYFVNSEVFSVIKDIPNYTNFSLSFFNGFIFVLLGKEFALKDGKILSKKQIIIALAIILPLMYVELFFTYLYHLNTSTDCFLTLVPLSLVLFQLALNINMKSFKILKRLRKYSTFLYLYHFNFIFWTFTIAKLCGQAELFAQPYMIGLAGLGAVVTGILLCELFSYLSKKKPLGFLKYSV